MKEYNLLLVVVICYLTFCVWNGYRKGLMKMALSVTVLFAAIFVSKMVSPYVEEYLNKETKIYEQVYENTDDYVKGVLEEKLGGLFSVADEAYVIEKLPLPTYIKTALTKNNKQEIYEKLGVSAFEEYISSALAEFIVTAIAYVITFLVVWIGIFILSKLLESIVRLPILNGINRFSGAAIGFLKGMIVLWILCLVVTATASTQTGQNILKMIDESQILSAIYNHNYLMRWVTEVVNLF